MNYISLYPESVFIYIFVLFVSIILSYFADKYNNKKYIVLLIIFLSLFAGLRHEFVGTDTQASMYLMDNSMLIDNSLNAREIGFRLVNIVLQWFFNSSRVSLIIYSFVICYLCVIRLWELRNKLNLTISLIVFYSTIYLQSFNLLRQTIAIALVFYGIRFLEKNKNLQFFVIIIIATSFHLSAPAGLLIFIVHDILSINFKRIKFSRVFYYVILIGMAYYALNIDRTQFLLNHYITEGQRIEGYTSFITITVITIIFVIERIPNIIHQKTSIESVNVNLRFKDNSLYYTYSIVYLIGVVLSVFLSKLLNASRITYYYTCLSIVFFSYKIDWRVMRNAKIVLCLIIVFRDLYSIFYNSGMGIMPYRFFWE